MVAQCSICLSPVTEKCGIALNCRHEFHKDCLVSLMARGECRCPVCRHRVDPTPIIMQNPSGGYISSNKFKQRFRRECDKLMDIDEIEWGSLTRRLQSRQNQLRQTTNSMKSAIQSVATIEALVSTPTTLRITRERIGMIERCVANISAIEKKLLELVEETATLRKRLSSREMLLSDFDLQTRTHDRFWETGSLAEII